MAPDASKKNRRNTAASSSSFGPPDVVETTLDDDNNGFVLVDNAAEEEEALSLMEFECVLEPRVLTDFSYVEQPVKCYLTCQGKRLACNGKSAVYMATTTNNSGTSTTTSSSKQDEFALLPHPDGSSMTMVIQNAQTQQYLCSSSGSATSSEGGPVYASHTHCNDLEKWTIVTESTSDSPPGHCMICSVASQRVLAVLGNTVHTISLQDNKHNNKHHHDNYHWKLEFTSGELCFLSLSSNQHQHQQQRQVRCNLIGELSLSKNFGGWEAWRFAEAGDGGDDSDGHYVRISPWAHSELLLVSDDQGWVSCSTMEDMHKKNEKKNTTMSCLWSVEKAPNGLHGVLIKAVLPSTTRRVLQYNRDLGSFCTIPDTPLLLDESSVFDLESLHRHTYYLATADNCQRLDGAKRGLSTRSTYLPGRLTSEEWKIEPYNNTNTNTNTNSANASTTNQQQQAGVVRLFNNARQQYLVSNVEGAVSLVSSSSLLCPRDGSEAWVMEEQEGGVLVVRSHKTQQVLVAPEKGPIATVPAGTIVMGNTRWRLEPKVPRQISKEKLMGVGSALAIGIVGTVSTPFLISGAIGAIGITSIGVAGQVTIGSIRAVEAINTVTRVTLSSSQLMISQSSSSSFLSASAADGSKKGYEKVANGKKKNRPFSAWQSW